VNWKKIIKSEYLLSVALTHTSYTNENGGEHYQRLEFLGDSCLDLLSAVQLMEKNPTQREGFLSQARADLVCTKRLAKLARDLNLNNDVRIGRGSSGIQNNDGLLADVMEALVGAAFTEGGLNSAKNMAVSLGIL
jgi:ribonuclease-3